ncbi:MAG: hypothetical protein M3Q68_10045 [Actinomycetota bacterium]|nr:hypothetical protein [Actinomycetota bacterium]
MSEDRDPMISRALRDLPVPDHGAGFWERLEAQLDPQPGRFGDEPVDEPVDEPGDGHGVEDEALPTVVAWPGRPAQRRGLRVFAVAAVVIGLVAVATMLTSTSPDERLRTADGPETTVTTSGAVVTTAPPPPSTATADVAVLEWLDAVGAGDTKAAAALTGARSVAYIEALGANLDGFLIEAGEGFGGWAESPDRSTTEVDLNTADGEEIVIVVVSGTWTGEGPDGFRTDAIPAVRRANGSWAVEPFAFDPEVGGRLEIESPTPAAEQGFNGLAPDAVLAAGAPGDGTFHFSLDDEPPTVVPGRKTSGRGGVRASFDPPGDLRSRTHLFVIAYVDGATVTAFAGTFAVEG